MRVIEKCERDRASVFVRVRVCVCVRLYSTPTTISRLPQKHSISNANRRGSKMGVEGVWGPDPRAIICRKTPVLHSRHTHTTSFPNNMTYFIQFRVLNRQRCQDDESAEYNDTWTLLDENKIPLYPCKKFVTNK